MSLHCVFLLVYVRRNFEKDVKIYMYVCKEMSSEDTVSRLTAVLGSLTFTMPFNLFTYKNNKINVNISNKSPNGQTYITQIHP